MQQSNIYDLSSCLATSIVLSLVQIITKQNNKWLKFSDSELYFWTILLQNECVIQLRMYLMYFGYVRRCISGT